MLNIDITEKVDCNTHVLDFSGEWDVYQKERAEHYFSEALSCNPQCIVADLSDITLIDSSGIEVLIIYHNKTSDMGIRLAVVAGSNNYIISKFQRLGIFSESGIDVFSTIDEAVAIK